MEVELLKKLVSESFSRKEVLDKLGKSTRGGTYITLNKYIRKYDIDISHFQHSKPTSISIPLEDILKDDVSYSSSRLKKRLFDAGLLKNICSICNQEPLWNGKELVHTLDHINGKHTDNRLENLRIVCRHCDSQLDTFGARNRKDLLEKRFCGCGKEIRKENKGGICQSCISENAKYSKDNECLDCGTIISLGGKRCSKCARKRYLEKGESISDNPVIKDNECLECGIPISKKNKRCRNCENMSRFGKDRKVERPSHKQLKEDIENMSMVAVGRKYGVSDNAIRKWIKQYEKI